jgi:hypothetical protein
MKALFNVVILPVSDPDAAPRFSRDQVRCDVDVDDALAPDFRVVQLTPQGAASIQFGAGLTDGLAGSVRGRYLVVPDIEARRRERQIVAWPSATSGTRDTGGGFLPGLDPNRGDYASFAESADPDGITWVLQGRGHS